VSIRKLSDLYKLPTINELKLVGLAYGRCADLALDGRDTLFPAGGQGQSLCVTPHAPPIAADAALPNWWSAKAQPKTMAKRVSE
jgi:hypothetical protein